MPIRRVKRNVTRRLNAFRRGGFRCAAPALLLLVGCTEPAPTRETAAPQPYVCLLPGERRMLVAELFFGRDIPGRKPLTEPEWAEFAREVVTPLFPAGFTVMDGAGQWQDPATGEISREPTRILLIAVPRSPDLARHLSVVIEAYKTRFHQQSVGVITRDSCAAF